MREEIPSAGSSTSAKTPEQEPVELERSAPEVCSQTAPPRSGNTGSRVQVARTPRSTTRLGRSRGSRGVAGRVNYSAVMQLAKEQPDLLPLVQVAHGIAVKYGNHFSGSSDLAKAPGIADVLRLPLRLLDKTLPVRCGPAGLENQQRLTGRGNVASPTERRRRVSTRRSCRRCAGCGDRRSWERCRADRRSDGS
jgi:hypothetical protein